MSWLDFFAPEYATKLKLDRERAFGNLRSEQALQGLIPFADQQAQRPFQPDSFGPEDPINQLRPMDLMEQFTRKGLFSMDEAKGLAGLLSVPQTAGFGNAILQSYLPQAQESQFAKIDPSKFTPQSIMAFQRSGGDYSQLIPIDGAESGPFAKINPKDFTASSIAKFQTTNNYADLAPITDQGEMDKKSAETFQRENTLRDEFTKGSGEFVKVSDAYGRIKASVTDPSAAGDMALIFNYMKMLDPGSTVREGEYATAQNATGVQGQVQSLYNRIIDGQRLNPDQRNDFLSRSDKLYQSQLKGLEKLEGQYTDLAKRYGVNPSNVVIDYRVNRGQKLSTEDQAAIDWANANPSDPRAMEIKKRLGVQ